MEDRNPHRSATAFICPHCRAFAQQYWFDVYGVHTRTPPGEADASRLREVLSETPKSETEKAEQEYFSEWLDAIEHLGLVISVSPKTKTAALKIHNAQLSKCFAYNRCAFWVDRRIVYPDFLPEVPIANADLSNPVLADYEEAARVLIASPRAACALLRLAIEKLCAEITKSNDDINGMIKTLVAKGLHVHIQRALDVVRVIGNEAVHPGTIDLSDDPETASQLFRLVNIIADTLVSQPKHIAEMYASLPPTKLAQIESRDAPKGGQTT
jgi:hypothetical protein